MLLVLNLHNLALVATLDSKLAAGLMLSSVLLVKLGLTAIVDTLEHGVAALVLMLGQIAVSHSMRAAFVSVLATGLKSG